MRERESEREAVNLGVDSSFLFLFSNLGCLMILIRLLVLVLMIVFYANDSGMKMAF